MQSLGQCLKMRRERANRGMWEGLRRGEGVLLVVTPGHQGLLSRFLDRVVCWDAQRTL